MAITNENLIPSGNKTPLFSVIVPVYNAESYLPQCIDSLLSQKFTDFEILLIDDGSTDRSPRICDEYAARHTHIRVLQELALPGTRGSTRPPENGFALSIVTTMPMKIFFPHSQNRAAWKRTASTCKAGKSYRTPTGKSSGFTDSPICRSTCKISASTFLPIVFSIITPPGQNFLTGKSSTGITSVSAPS